MGVKRFKQKRYWRPFFSGKAGYWGTCSSPQGDFTLNFPQTLLVALAINPGHLLLPHLSKKEAPV